MFLNKWFTNSLKFCVKGSTKHFKNLHREESKEEEKISRKLWLPVEGRGLLQCLVCSLPWSLSIIS
jgi:hypothetical protein